MGDRKDVSVFKISMTAGEFREAVDFGRELKSKLIDMVLKSLTGGMTASEFDALTGEDFRRMVGDKRVRARVIGVGYALHCFEAGMPSEMQALRALAEALCDELEEIIKRKGENEPDPLDGKPEDALDIAGKLADRMCDDAKH